MNPRLPAEWEIQDGVLMTWPHKNTDWASVLHEVKPVFIEIIRHIIRFELVVLVVPNELEVAEELIKAGIDLSKITFCEAESNDTWSRDFGPITVIYNDKPVLMDFAFNGWGLKFPANFDNQISRILKQNGKLKPKLNCVGLVLEGGSIETDGLGTILTTTNCLLSPNRNPQLDQNELAQAFGSLLGAKRILWLNHGLLIGDDTDSHIDTLARICPNNTIVYQGCNNPVDEHYEQLKQMEKELSAFTAPDGSSYRTLQLPWPKACFDSFAHRLPATYANFLIINGAVLVPTYRDHENDIKALEIITSAFPGREIIGIDCLPLLEQHGSLHCITMQLPQGVVV